MVVEQQACSLVILVQILDPLPLLEHAGLDAIPLSRVVNSEVDLRECTKTYPGRLFVQKSPHTISDSSGVPHCSSRRIEGTIPRLRIDHPMMKEFVQNPLISGQLLPLWAQFRVKPPQSDQGLVPDNVVQRASHRPRRTSCPLIGMIGRRYNLQERLDSLPRRGQPHLPVVESSMRPDHRCAFPRVAFRPELPCHGCRSQTCGS